MIIDIHISNHLASLIERLMTFLFLLQPFQDYEMLCLYELVTTGERRRNAILYYYRRISLHKIEDVRMSASIIMLYLHLMTNIMLPYRRIILLVKFKLKCTIGHTSRATFGTPAKRLNITIYPILFHRWFWNCCSWNNSTIWLNYNIS